MEPLLRDEAQVVYDPKTGLAVPRLAVFMVFLTIFMDTLAATISTPALPYYAREFGATNADIGYLFAAWSLTSTFCAPFLGFLSDKIGRRKVLLMSLLGAGIANIGQFSATSYWILLAWRAFSGVWAAVTSTAQVYLTDVCAPEVLNDYMSKLSAMPGAAMIFGPGLGGGLSIFGLNFPILVDGALSIAAAGLVFLYLPESPEWSPTRSSNAQKEAGAPVKPTPIPRRVYVLGCSGFLSGIAFGTRVSMMVVALNKKLGYNALQVGYLYVAFAIMSLTQSFWVTPRAQRHFGVFAVAIAGTLIQGAFTPIGFAVTEGALPCILCLVLANMGFSFRMAANGPLSALFTDSTNRGAVFAQVQMMTNCGRMVGPLVSGNLAVTDPVTLPWYFSGSCCALSALFLLPLIPYGRAAAEKGSKMPRRLRGFTDLIDGAPPPDETGSPEDYQRVGEFVGNLLRERNYPWVSHQAAVFQMLDRLLPPLRSQGSERYEDLELLAQHAEQMQHEFATGDRQHGSLL